ncbi:MAG: photosynthetic complex assembly protein PuhC [Alphaproteobacteria bacterium]|nr:photosynthetic complex assembly protein PuhC [Alphaproteobacteria bacterium]
MAEAQAQNHTPTPFLVVVAGLVLAAVLAVGTAPWWRDTTVASQVAPRIMVVLQFEVESSGNLIVRKFPGGELVDALNPDESGFLRTMVRVIRRDLGAGANVDSMPFQLSAWQDGRMSLVDTATGRSVELRAFGPTQAGVFLRWINAEEGRR